MASADMTLASTPSLYRLPLFGALARAVAHASALPLVVIAGLLALWGAAVALLGLPALYLPAVATSPLMIVVLVLISLG